MNSPNYSPQSRTVRNNKYSTKDSNTNTSDDLFRCQKCNRNISEINDGFSPSTIVKDYLDAMNYINSCHVLINQIVQSRLPGQNVSIPQIPNFLNVATYIARDIRGLAELKNVNGLEKLMQEFSASLPDTTLKTLQRESLSRMMTDKQVQTLPVIVTNAETTMKKVASEKRVTGIPIRIRNNSKLDFTKDRSPCGFRATSIDLLRFGRHKSTSSLMSKPSMSLIAVKSNVKPRDESLDSEIPEQNCKTDGDSDKESVTLSTDDLDDYAKDLLLNVSSRPGQSSASRSPNKTRKVRHKSKRDFEMIKSFLKQFGIEMPQMNSESEESLVLPRGRSSVYLKSCYNELEKTDKSSVPAIETVPEVESDLDTTIMENKGTELAASSSPKGFNERQTNLFNELAATTEGLENTFITNEKPVWHNSRNVSGASDSDIEPDLEEEITTVAGRHHVQIMRGAGSKCGTLQTNPNTKTAYVVTQKPKDKFLMPRRPKSHSDIIDSSFPLVESDMDDEAFEKLRKRPKTSCKRHSVLPEQILSNIGILTQTGQVKPEKERELQELRSRLASDMQTTLFRKPRNRKMETNDIVHLHSHFNQSDKA